MKPCLDAQPHDLMARLSCLAADYAATYGPAIGLEQMGEQLCRLADDEALYAKGWAGLVQFLKRAAG